MGFFDWLFRRKKANLPANPPSSRPAAQGGTGPQAKVVYLFTTSPLSDATTARLGSDMLGSLPAGTRVPDNCRTVPLQIGSGASKAQLEKVLGAKAEKEAGCSRSLCVVTSGSDADAREGYFIGF